MKDLLPDPSDLRLFRSQYGRDHIFHHRIAKPVHEWLALHNKPSTLQAERDDAQAFVRRQQRMIQDYIQSIQELEAEVERLNADVVEASGALMVPLPEPGSDLAKVMRVNRILRDEKSSTYQEIRALRAELSTLRALGSAPKGDGSAEDCMTDIMGHATRQEYDALCRAMERIVALGGLPPGDYVHLQNIRARYAH